MHAAKAKGGIRKGPALGFHAHPVSLAFPRRLGIIYFTISRSSISNSKVESGGMVRGTPRLP